MTDSGRASRTITPVVTALSVVWALAPLVSLGFLAPIVFGFAAGRRRSPVLWAATACYTVLVVTEFSTSKSASGGVGDVLFNVALVACMFGATAHALAIRRSVFAPRLPDRNEEAIEAARLRTARRREARELLAGDPGLADELRIGRPDLPREYDDGGLVDVNNVPPAVLATLPGMNRELVARIVRARADAGSFVSVEELSAVADLPPHLTPDLAEYTIFR